MLKEICRVHRFEYLGPVHLPVSNFFTHQIDTGIIFIHGSNKFTRLQLKLSRVNFFTHQIELCEFISAGDEIIPVSIFLHTKLTRVQFYTRLK